LAECPIQERPAETTDIESVLYLPSRMEWICWTCLVRRYLL